MPNRLMTLLAMMTAVMVGVSAGFIATGTTTVSAATFTYDAHAIARVDTRPVDRVEARPAQLSDAQERSVSPLAKSGGPSTAPSRSRNATESGSTLVYRGGSRTPDNLTPRPGIDDTGLSTYDTPGAAAPSGGKVQVIDTSRLKCTIACPDAPPPGHVSIRPPDAADIPGWAGTRGTGQISPFTQDIMDAIIDEIRLPRS
jgi:hypothetical protein